MDSDISHAVEERLVRIENKLGLPPIGEEEEEPDQPDVDGEEEEEDDDDLEPTQ